MNLKLLLLAFALIESSHNPYAIGDNGKAKGLYQFHIARWIECGGTKENWGTPNKAIQDQIMINEIMICLKQYKHKKMWEKGISPLEAITTYHNSGHIRSGTAYTEKVSKELKRLESMGY